LVFRKNTREKYDANDTLGKVTRHQNWNYLHESHSIKSTPARRNLEMEAVYPIVVSPSLPFAFWKGVERHWEQKEVTTVI
jgi:hypothetical protein